MRKPIHNPRHAFSSCLSTLILVTLAAASRGDDWMTWTSSYTHSPQTGERVDQYALAEQPISPYRQDFTRSGYRHYRSTLQAGQSADNMHIVEQWGQPIVPYEQWRFPFRPYAVPYDAWGPQAPYGITNGSFQYGVGGGNWGAHHGGPYPPRPGSEGGYGSGRFPEGQTEGQSHAPLPPGQSPGDHHPHPNYPRPNRPGQWGGYYNGGYGQGNYGRNDSRGFPLTPTYNNEPWYDGNYPTVPPLGER